MQYGDSAWCRNTILGVRLRSRHGWTDNIRPLERSDFWKLLCLGHEWTFPKHERTWDHLLLETMELVSYCTFPWGFLLYVNYFFFFWSTRYIYNTGLLNTLFHLIISTTITDKSKYFMEWTFYHIKILFKSVFIRFTVIVDFLHYFITELKKLKFTNNFECPFQHSKYPS